MKNLITILLLFFGVRSVVGAELIEPDRPIYQMDWGIMPPGNMWIAGKWSEREQSKAKTAKEQELQIKLDNMAVLAAKGRRSIQIGISALVLGIILLLYLNQNHLQWIGSGVACFGIWRFSSGLIEVKLAENWQVITGALLVGIIIIIAGAMLWSRGVNKLTLQTFAAWFKRKG